MRAWPAQIGEKVVDSAYYRSTLKPHVDPRGTLYRYDPAQDAFVRNNMYRYSAKRSDIEFTALGSKFQENRLRMSES